MFKTCPRNTHRGSTTASAYRESWGQRDCCILRMCLGYKSLLGTRFWRLVWGTGDQLCFGGMAIG